MLFFALKHFGMHLNIDFLKLKQNMVTISKAEQASSLADGLHSIPIIEQFYQNLHRYSLQN
ncbi:hypothetical protein YSY43_40290 [Paenibacillus sp. YSY-4.3]